MTTVSVAAHAQTDCHMFLLLVGILAMTSW